MTRQEMIDKAVAVVLRPDYFPNLVGENILGRYTSSVGVIAVVIRPFVRIEFQRIVAA